MRKHILWLITGLLLLSLLLWGAKQLDARISMPLFGTGTVEDGTENDNNTVDTTDADAAAVDALIAGIGTPVTADSREAIDAARSAYNMLSGDAKAKVGKLPELEAAEKALAVVDAAADAAVVDALIAGIGTPVTADSKAAIDAARAAFDMLSGDAKAMAAKLPELEAAEKALKELNDAGMTDADGLTNQNSPENVFDPGAAVTFLGGEVYVSSKADSESVTIEAQSACTVTYFVDDAAHPYHLISQDGGGVYGWVDASSVKEG